MIRIGSFAHSEDRARNEQTFSAEIDGFDVFFTLPGDLRLARRADAFLALAMIPAMLAGRDVRVDDDMAVSARLMGNLALWQRIRRQWNPVLSIVDVAATTETYAPSNPGIVSCSFSGGVDSAHTVNANADITHLFMTDVFDLGQGEEATRQKREDIARKAALLGKKDIFVTTNARAYIEAQGLHWNMINGNAMGALFSSVGVAKHYLPSSYTYFDLQPYGSHILTDPLWGTEATEIVHDGLDYERSEKTELIARNPTLLDNLQVCWIFGTRNCGSCSKCCRTMLVLDIIGKRGPFPDRFGPMRDRLERLMPRDPSHAAFTRDLASFARRKGEPEIERELSRLLRSFAAKKARDDYIVSLFGERVLAFLKRKPVKKDRLVVRLRHPSVIDR